MRAVFAALLLALFSIANAVAAGRVVSVKVSPDQQQVAMVVAKQSGMSLLLSKTGGTPIELFQSSSMDIPKWSSNGKRLAWIDYQGVNRQLCVYRLSAQRQRCYHFPGWHLLSLRWRPKTDQIALLARVNNHNPNMPNQVLLWHVSESKPRVLTHANQNITAMTWSADGNTLVLQNTTDVLPRFWEYQWPKKVLTPVILLQGKIDSPVFAHKGHFLAYTINIPHGKLICTVMLGTGHHACADHKFDPRSQLLGWTADNRLLIQRYQDVRSGLIILSVPGFNMSELNLSPAPQRSSLNGSGTALGYVDAQGQAYQVNLQTQQIRQVIVRREAT